MKFNGNLKSLHKKESQLEVAIGVIAAKIQSVCDFEIHVHNISDGWCVLSDVTGFPLNMRLSDVINIIEEKGKLTEDDWSPFG